MNYLTVNRVTRTVRTNLPEGDVLVVPLADPAIAIMDAEQTGVRDSSLEAMLDLLTTYASAAGFATHETRVDGFLTEIGFTAYACQDCHALTLNDCLHM